MGGYFTSDRAAKYGWGVPRLALVTLFAFEIVPRAFLAGSPRTAIDALTSTPAPFTAAAAAAPFAPLTFLPYVASLRWTAHAYTGSIGAGVNVQVLGLWGNLAIMAVAGGLCLWDLTKDVSLVVYFLKTFCGDQLAGKLDTAEWKLVLAFTFALPTALWYGAGTNEAAYAVFQPYLRILPILFVVQAICEFGDAHLEYHPLVGKFFRHRYGFEAFTMCVLTLMPGGITTQELRVVQFDLVICLAYRVANLAIILHKQNFFTNVLAGVAINVRKQCFRVFGLLSGQRIVNVTDAEVATAVMRASDVKGDALERHVATPAWRPLLSLESVDHDLYRDMLADFHKVVKACPPPSRVGEIARAKVDELMYAVYSEDADVAGRDSPPPSPDRPVVNVTVAPHAHKDGDASECPFMQMKQTATGGSSSSTTSASVIDADAIARLSLSVFIEYLFKRDWEPRFDVLLAASWEWRKEIAVRGRANPGVKKAAVELVVDDLIKNSHLWELFGEKWREPRYYSLIMQPFLVSPAINVGDIAVAMKRYPDLALEPAMRRMHPFPIFERYVDQDVVVKGKVAVRAKTQVIMFTSDFSGSKHLWPAFGSGPRACAGTSMALGVLNAIHGKMLGRPGFEPERGHKFSGRNNDGVTSFAEVWYFAKTVLPVVAGFGGEKTTEAAALERAAAAALE